MADPLATIETADLVVFTAVVRNGSLGAAATELAMSGPSVSTRIAALERRIGAVLLDRGARGSTPTPAGERLFDYATRCLELLDEATLSVPAHAVRRLVLAAPASIGDVLFAPALSVLAESAVKAHCRVAHSGEVVGRIVDGSVHAGFVIAKVPLRGLSAETLGSSAFAVLGHADHPQVARGATHVDDLVDTSVVVYRWGRDAQRLAALFEHPHRRPSAPVHTTGSPAAALRLASTGNYLAVVPLLCAAEQLSTGGLRALPVPLPDWNLDVQFVYTTAGRPEIQLLLANLPTLCDTVEYYGCGN